MYNMPYFKEKDFDVVKSFMHQYPFIILCGVDADNKPVVTHVPVLIEQREDALYLLGHFMRNTDHHKAFKLNTAAMAVFTGPHTYVSASWYTDQQSASTWNYMTVHAKGDLAFVEEAALINILERTTAHFENNEHSPSLVNKMQEGYVSKLAKAIIGFEIKVANIDNVFKLSQNRNQKSFENIVNQLEQQDAESKAVAAEMQKRKDQIFSS